MTTQARLTDIGDQLERAVATDLRTRSIRSRQAASFARRPRLLAVLAAVLVVGVPSAAIASGVFTSGATVAASMPAGTKFLVGSHPTCTAVATGIEYHCTLDAPPTPASAAEQSNPNSKADSSAADSTLSGIAAGQFKGTVEATVDATRHVNGGCRAVTTNGAQWDCYIGPAAVSQRIIGAQLLGQFQSGPSVG